MAIPNRNLRINKAQTDNLLELTRSQAAHCEILIILS